MNGHKQMTEFIMIVHRKDPSGQPQAVQGKFNPNTKQVEEVLGASKAGSWHYDFMTDQLPPSKECYVLRTLRAPPRHWICFRRLRYEEESAGDKKGTAVRQCMEKGPNILASFILK